MESEESKLKEKISEIENALKNLQKVSEVVVDFENIRKDIDEKRDDLSKRASEIFQRLDEEDETYKVFQSIKEKAIISIEEYSHQLQSVKKELLAISEQINEMEKNFKGDIGQIFSNSKELNLQPTFEKLETARKQKKIFEQINSSVISLEQSLDGISKRLALLSKQADIIELHQHNLSVPKEKKTKEEEKLESEIELTKSEQLEYEMKRKELMGMIKKLWEE
jgi:copper chaperone CopZ